MKFLTVTISLLLMMVLRVNAADNTLARQVHDEINLARTEPMKYAGILRRFRSGFSGKLYRRADSKIRVKTSEGLAAVDEAIRFLSRSKPLNPLTWSEGMAKAASELVEEQGENGDTGHRDRRGYGPRERVERHGQWERSLAENIGYGPDQAREMIIQLIVDDGVPDRGHRKNIFNGAFSVSGSDCGPHPHFGTMCVIEFAGGFSQ